MSERNFLFASATATHSAGESSAITELIQKASDRLSSRTQWLSYLTALVINDITMILGAYGLAYWIRFGFGLEIFAEDAIPSIPFYGRIVLILLPLWIVAFYFGGLYDRKNLLGDVKEYARVFNTSTLIVVFFTLLDFMVQEMAYARGWLLLSWVFCFLFVAGGRFILRRIVYTLRRQGFFMTHALIVGANDEGYALVQQLTDWQTSGLNILGFVDDEIEPGDQVFTQFVGLGQIDQLEAIVDRYNVEEIIIASGGVSHETLQSIFKRFGVRDDVTIRLSSGLFGLVTNGLEVTQMAFVPLIRVNKMRFTRLEDTLKRLFDFIVVILLLLIIWPVLIIIALAIKRDSPGPAIYCRRVMGLNGRQFDAYKFRTMHIDGDQIIDQYPDLKEELGRNHKLKEDPRVTKVGGFIRKYSLDELPQLFNVLRRDMSLIGPRMISPEEMPLYGKWSMNLLTVRPGITGLWQVSGRSDTTYEERVRLDMYYIRNWTIWSDIYLLWLTVPAVLKKRGAY
jgi:exopolysaccharide biosynthesis polyprenyl glycosylphosphotransferase